MTQNNNSNSQEKTKSSAKGNYAGKYKIQYMCIRILSSLNYLITIAYHCVHMSVCLRSIQILRICIIGPVTYRNVIYFTIAVQRRQ